jgi:hypothetical protein
MVHAIGSVCRQSNCLSRRLNNACSLTNHALLAQPTEIPSLSSCIKSSSTTRHHHTTTNAVKIATASLGLFVGCTSESARRKKRSIAKRNRRNTPTRRQAIVSMNQALNVTRQVAPHHEPNSNYRSFQAQAQAQAVVEVEVVAVVVVVVVVSYCLSHITVFSLEFIKKEINILDQSHTRTHTAIVLLEYQVVMANYVRANKCFSIHSNVAVRSKACAILINSGTAQKNREQRDKS